MSRGTASLFGRDADHLRCSGFYAGYEYSKRAFQAHYHTESIPVWATLTSGGLGGIAYWTACYPLGELLHNLCDEQPADAHVGTADVVKSRIQLQDAPPRGFNYIFNTFRAIYREEGARSFVRGISPTCALTLRSASSSFDTDASLQISERA